MKSILVRNIGKHNGCVVSEYTLRSESVDVVILNLGGIIKEIRTVDKIGKKENVVLAYDRLEDYFTNKSYYGALIGRTAGRIANGKVTIDGKEYKLNNNYDVCNCHGGNSGFDKKIWAAKHIELENETRLELSCVSEHEEENYPGNVYVKVVYTLNNKGEFEISYFAKSDRKTLMNLTNHSYFNLSGDYKSGIEDHYMTVTSDSILAIDSDGVATGEIIDIAGSAFDFNSMKRIGKDIDSDNEQVKLGAGYDHPFVLNGEKKMVLKDKVSGRIMEVTTDNNTAVIYSMNYPDGILGLGRKDLKRRYGICFECQNKPIGYNEAFKEESLLGFGEIYKRSTRFKFSVSKDLI